MKDFLGNTVEVEDTVIFSLPNYRYTLIKGTVTKITNCYFFIEYLEPGISSSDYSTVKQTSSQVIKAPEKPK